MKTLIAIIILLGTQSAFANLCEKYLEHAATLESNQEVIRKGALKSVRQISYYETKMLDATLKGKTSLARKMQKTIDSLKSTQITYVEAWLALEDEYVVFMNSRVSWCKKTNIEPKEAPIEMVVDLPGSITNPGPR